MKIKFEITDVPTRDQEKYPTAYLEGNLKIFIYDILFFNQNNILLIEFAVFVSKWLSATRQDMVVNFMYESMDHEAVILSIIHAHDDCYNIHSLWEEIKYVDFLSKEEITTAFQQYLTDLDISLKLQTKISLTQVLRDN